MVFQWYDNDKVQIFQGPWQPESYPSKMEEISGYAVIPAGFKVKIGDQYLNRIFLNGSRILFETMVDGNDEVENIIISINSSKRMKGSHLVEYACPNCYGNDLWEFFAEDNVYNCSGFKIDPFRPRVCSECYTDISEQEGWNSKHWRRVVSQPSSPIENIHAFMNSTFKMPKANFYDNDSWTTYGKIVTFPENFRIKIGYSEIKYLDVDETGLKVLDEGGDYILRVWPETYLGKNNLWIKMAFYCPSCNIERIYEDWDKNTIINCMNENIEPTVLRLCQSCIDDMIDGQAEYRSRHWKKLYAEYQRQKQHLSEQAIFEIISKFMEVF